MEWKNITNGEGGLSVRSKINTAFNDLIHGNEGIHKLWEAINSLIARLTKHEETAQKELDDLQNSVRKSQAYVDKQTLLTLQKVTKQVTEVQNATLRNKGYFSSESVLKQEWFTSEAGTIAYVGTSSPYKIYKWSNDGGWFDTGQTHTGEPANFHGYPKIGFVTDEGNIQLIEYDGDSVFPIAQASGVYFVDGMNLERKVEEIINEYTHRCDKLEDAFTVLSSEEYDALTTKDPDKLYFVYEE